MIDMLCGKSITCNIGQLHSLALIIYMTTSIIRVPENVTLKCNYEMYAEGVYILVHTHPQHILHNFSS